MDRGVAGGSGRGAPSRLTPLEVQSPIACHCAKRTYICRSLVLESKGRLTHLSAVPISGVGLLCNLMIRNGGLL
jgi:hypothetical protein